MATIVNTPATDRRDTGPGYLLAMILLVIVVAALLFYGLPYLTRGFSSGPGLSVPSKIDVNVNNPAAK